MLWLIILALLVVLSIIILIYGINTDECCEFWAYTGAYSTLIFGLLLLIFSGIAIFKDIDYNAEMREYQLIKEQVENCSDETIKAIGIYDKVMELNRNMIYAQEHKNSPWRGAFVAKSYCNMEIIKIKEK